MQARGGRLIAVVVLAGLALRAYHYLRQPEIWHDDHGYMFAKFLAPTIADGRVYLPTFSPDRANRSTTRSRIGSLSAYSTSVSARSDAVG